MYDIISLNHKCGIALQGKSSPRHKMPTMMDKRNKFTPHLNSKTNLDLNTQNFHQKPKLLTTIP